MERIRQVLRRRQRELMSLPHVVGVGIGRKMVGGKDSGDEALVVLVDKKVAEPELSRSEKVPRVLSRCCTDVIEVGQLQLLGVDRTGRQRPARPGVSIGHYKITAGTFGAVVRDKATGAPLILSNNHVLANSTNGNDSRARAGDPILQPGRYDGGTMDDTIGYLIRFSPLARLYSTPSCRRAARVEMVGNAMLHIVRPNYRLVLERRTPQGNIIDAAVAKPINPDVIAPDILEIGPVTGTAEPELGMTVVKSGRSSGLNTSHIQVTSATVRVNLEGNETGLFNDQIVTGPLALPGDSGSLVLDEQHRAVGLLFAGSDVAAICNRITNVLEVLQVTF